MPSLKKHVKPKHVHIVTAVCLEKEVWSISQVFSARLGDEVQEKLIDMDVRTEMCSFIEEKGG